MSLISKKVVVPKFNVPGFPMAPVSRKPLQGFELDYLARKAKLAHRLPFFTPEEVARRKHSYHVVILHELLLNGYNDVVREVASILKKEERELKIGKVKESIIADKTKFKTMAEALRVCHDYFQQGNYETVATIRKDEGEKLMKSHDIWLAKHFLFTALNNLKRMICYDLESVERRNRAEAEIHCLLAFIARDNCEDLEQALEAAVNHLVVCRELSKKETWQFKPRVISIRLLKPIAIHGLRNEYEVIDGCSMTVYMIATLLEHEMLIGLANQILHFHRYPSPEDLEQAHILADHALRLAFEVRQPIALSSALMRFGVVLRHTGEYDDAIKYFRQLAHHCEVTQDEETLAIAHHNIGMCQLGTHESTAALESLAKQKVISDMFYLKDLQADALQELGLVLLLEGHLWESEECYAAAYDMFSKIEVLENVRHNHTNATFVMSGVSAGEKLWSRFTGLARSENYEDLVSILNWKNQRDPLKQVDRPNYTIQTIKDAMEKVAQIKGPPAQPEPSTVADEGEEEEEEEEEEEINVNTLEVEPDMELLLAAKSMPKELRGELAAAAYDVYLSDLNHQVEVNPTKLPFTVQSKTSNTSNVPRMRSSKQLQSMNQLGLTSIRSSKLEQASRKPTEAESKGFSSLELEVS